MKSKILVTGGSGLIGIYLSKLLVKEGFEVRHLSRHKSNKTIYPTFLWDIRQGFIEEGAFDGVDYIVHLAGAGVADKRWTDKRKQMLTSSRVDSADLIHKYLENNKQRVVGFISASAIGIYGFNTGDALQTEDQKELGNDFLANLTKTWEAAADRFEQLGIRVVKLRFGLVLSEKGGLLDKMLPISKVGLGAAFGDGQQYMSWIHIEDLAKIIMKAIRTEEINGAYNAVAPNPETNDAFMKQLAETLNRPYFMPNIPKFAMRLALGELAMAITGGNKVSSKKIENTGFTFRFTTLKAALNHLLKQ